VGHIAARRGTDTGHQDDATHCTWGVFVTREGTVVESFLPSALARGQGTETYERIRLVDALGKEAYRIIESESEGFSRPCTCTVHIDRAGHNGHSVTLHFTPMELGGQEHGVFVLDPSATYLALLGGLIEALSTEQDRKSIIAASLALFIRHDSFSYASCFLREKDQRFVHFSTAGKIPNDDIARDRSSGDPDIAAMVAGKRARIATNNTYLEDCGRAYGVSAPMIILVPLTEEGGVRGFIELVTSEDAPPLCDMEVLTRCGGLISCALLKADSYFEDLGRYSLISNVLDSSHHYFIVVDSEQATQYVNSAFVRYTGQTSASMPTLAQWHKFLDDESYRRMKQLVANVLLLGEPLSATFPLYTPRGDHSHVQWRVLPLRGEGGVVRGAVCIGGDVTAEVDNEERISLLCSLVAEIIGLTDEERIVERAATIIEQITEYDTFMLTLNDPSRGETVVKYGGGEAESGYAYPIEKGRGIISHVAATGKRYIMERRQGDPLYIQGSAEGPVESEVAVPIRSRGVVYGVLNFELLEQHVFGGVEVRLLETMADILAIALSNARLVTSLEHERHIISNLLDAANNYIVIFDADLNVRSINSQLAALGGFSKDGAFGWDEFTSIVPKGDFHRVTQRLKWVVENGKLDRNINVLNDEQKGSVIVSWYNSPIKDEDGTVTGIISIGQDITQRIKLEMRLVESNLFTSSVIENVNVGIAVVNREGTVLQANPAYLSWVERSQDTVIGASFDTTFPQCALDLHAQCEDVFSSRKRVSTEITARVNGTKKVASLTILPFELPPVDSVLSFPFHADESILDDLHEDTAGTRALVMVYDITARAKAEHATTHARERLERIIS
ncbi:MAG TPA: PAS domain S-box protein, partial [Methanomicrobia archaeon]|nr:PAS domain S-box protein [Methanomicrobia archaeon]